MHEVTYTVLDGVVAPARDEETTAPPLAVEARLAAAEAKVAHLEVALASARVIGAAVGIVMVQQKVTYNDAFGALVRASQHQNRKLHAIADEVVNYGGVIDAVAR